MGEENSSILVTTNCSHPNLCSPSPKRVFFRLGEERDGGLGHRLPHQFRPFPRQGREISVLIADHDSLQDPAQLAHLRRDVRIRRHLLRGLEVLPRFGTLLPCRLNRPRDELLGGYALLFSHTGMG